MIVEVGHPTEDYAVARVLMAMGGEMVIPLVPPEGRLDESISPILPREVR